MGPVRAVARGMPLVGGYCARVIAIYPMAVEGRGSVRLASMPKWSVRLTSRVGWTPEWGVELGVGYECTADQRIDYRGQEAYTDPSAKILV